MGLFRHFAVFIIVVNEYITICENTKTANNSIIAYSNEYLVLIMGLEWIVMRTFANYNILRKVVLVLRQVGV